MDWSFDLDIGCFHPVRSWLLFRRVGAEDQSFGNSEGYPEIPNRGSKMLLMRNRIQANYSRWA